MTRASREVDVQAIRQLDEKQLAITLGAPTTAGVRTLQARRWRV
jgi:hypothetical protein